MTGTKLTVEQADKLIEILKAINNHELDYLQVKDKGLQQLGFITNFSEYYEVDDTNEVELFKFLTSHDIEDLSEATISVSLPNEVLDKYSEDEVYTLTQLVTEPVQFYALKEVQF